MGPFQVVLDALLSDATVRTQLDLEDVRVDHVQARLPGDFTGPSTSSAIVVRHPRLRVDSQVDWTDSDLQNHGRQATDELNYIMESKPERGLHIFMHGQPPPAASGSRGASPSSGCSDILRKQLLEDEPALQIVRHGVDCEKLAEQRPLAPGARSWRRR